MTGVLRPRSLRGRLTLWYTAVLAALLIAFGAAAFVLLDRTLRATVDASLVTMARTIAESSRAPARADDLGATLEALLGPAFTRRFFALLDPLGRPDPRLPASAGTALRLSPTALRNAARGQETYETLVPPARPPAAIRVLTLPIVEGGQVVSLVQTALSLDAVDSARSRFLFVLLALTPLALAAAAVGGRWLATRALAPVAALVDATTRIEAGDLTRRLAPGDAGEEIDRLAGVLNDMLARLERSFSAVRRFSADAAHELRTPLTILKGELEVALRGAVDAGEYRRVLASCAEEVDHLSAMVEDLLLLARADAGAAELPEVVDLAAIVAEAGPGLRALVAPAGVTVTVLPGPPVRVRGSEALLLRVVFNLVDNAAKYGGPTVVVSATARNRQAVLEVRDDGPGVPAGERERIFEPFYRADAARARRGTGLGLAVVRSIVLLHGGTIAVESPPGGGTCFRIRFPSAD